ncbi:hypothetical protein WN51_03267 [Melipona quadrifasciata]|uniref:Uncharacterized protein n=1 Tax=Melipona quadrifasciata TaxID=166423 RepID=A0A0M8ZW12_9HYME|nr:hypothetical protein WN51_03267 [Melipona quadrifasciata]
MDREGATSGFTVWWQWERLVRACSGQDDLHFLLLDAVARERGNFKSHVAWLASQPAGGKLDTIDTVEVSKQNKSENVAKYDYYMEVEPDN